MSRLHKEPLFSSTGLRKLLPEIPLHEAFPLHNLGLPSIFDKSSLRIVVVSSLHIHEQLPAVKNDPNLRDAEAALSAFGFRPDKDQDC
jgi:hypothetical protein